MIFGVQRFYVFPADEVIGFLLHALVRVVIEVRREVCLEMVAIDVDNVAIEKVNEVCATNAQHVVAGFIMLVDFKAAGLEKLCNIVGAEERRSYFEAASAPERPIDIIDANDCVTEFDVIIAEHVLADAVQ